MPFIVNFPKVGECRALLYHDAESVHNFINKRAWHEVGAELKKIDECNRVKIYFPDDHEEVIFGKTYKRINLEMRCNRYTRWQGMNEGGKCGYSMWQLTDAANKVMKERHEEMLLAAYNDLRAALIEPTKKEWLNDLEREITKEREKLSYIENKIRIESEKL